MREFVDEFKNSFLENKNNIFKFILGIYAYWSIVSLMNLKGSYNVFVIFILVGILFLFFKVKPDNSLKKIILFTSIILALLISIGSKVALCIDVASLNIFYLRSIIHIILLTVGLSIFFYYFFNLVFPLLKKVNLIVNSKRLSPNKIFLISLIIIMLLWLPYFIRYFPGLLSIDSRLQLHYIEDVILANNHPFVQTWFEGGIYNLGKFLFHNNNLAMAFYTFVQMLILATIFAYAVRFLYKHKFNSLVIVLVLLAYGLLPQYTIYSVTIWKDVLFGGAMLLILVSIAEMTLSDRISKSTLIIFIISVLMVMFFRNNGIYIILVCLPFLLYSFRRNIKIIGMTLISLVIFYFVVTGPIYSFIGVGKSNAVESSAMALQQVGRVIAKEERISKSEEKYLKTLFDFKEIKEVYNPTIADPVKNHADKERFDKTKVEFYKTWLGMSYKHFKTYVEAYLSQTLGYWFPSVKYWTTIGTVDENSYGVHYVKLLPAGVNKVIDATKSLNLTFSSIFWGIGFGFILLFLSIITAIIRGIDKSLYFAWFVPCVGLWITMMIAAPVYAEYRYVYGLFTSLPVIILLPYIFRPTRK